jgi:4a-hydroxytetrahydrobiopterin dehydratase
MNDLTTKKCQACTEWTPVLTGEKLGEMMGKVSHEWKLGDDEKKISRELVFKNFVEAVGFVNKLADLAEEEGHHPDILIYSYKKVRVTLYTHKIGGLSENDFILAAKMDKLI